MSLSIDRSVSASHIIQVGVQSVKYVTCYMKNSFFFLSLAVVFTPTRVIYLNIWATFPWHYVQKQILHKDFFCSLHQIKTPWNNKEKQTKVVGQQVTTAKFSEDWRALNSKEMAPNLVHFNSCFSGYWEQIQYGTLPWYLYLGHCFQLWNTFIFLPLFGFYTRAHILYAAQMQNMHTLSHVLGPCHRGKNSLETFPEQSVAAAISKSRLKEGSRQKKCLQTCSSRLWLPL